MATVGNAKTDLGAMLSGTNLNDVSSVDNALERAARNVISNLDPAATRRIANLSQALHDDVFQYSAPSDLKEIIDLRPQVNRTEADSFVRQFAKEFGKYKNRADDVFTIQHDDGTKFLNISKNVDIEVAKVIQDFDTASDWTAGANASNVTADSQFYITGNTSINFDLSAGSDGDTGHITASGFTSVDISEHEDVGSIFLWIYFPDSSIITNVNTRWGSGASAYWDRTVTAQHNGNAFRNGWNLLRSDWNGATETGSPDSSAVDYARVTVTYNGTAETDIRVDNMFASTGEIFEVVYYSQFLFRTSGGTWNETITNDTDIINLEPEGYNIFLYEALKEMAHQIMGADSSSTIQYANNQLYGGGGQVGLYAQYKSRNPSEALKTQSTYYRVRGVNWGLGR